MSPIMCTRRPLKSVVRASSVCALRARVADAVASYSGTALPCHVFHHVVRGVLSVNTQDQKSQTDQVKQTHQLGDGRLPPRLRRRLDPAHLEDVLQLLPQARHHAVEVGRGGLDHEQGLQARGPELA